MGRFSRGAGLARHHGRGSVDWAVAPRPHALLDVQATSVDDWISGLSRRARTLAKAATQDVGWWRDRFANDRGAALVLAHFRCVVEHEVRLLAADGDNDFFDALGQAIGRYRCVSQAGEIREYRQDSRVIALAHEVTKGKVIRGQWFYATDRAAATVWFHSVRDLVERAIADPP